MPNASSRPGAVAPAAPSVLERGTPVVAHIDSGVVIGEFRHRTATGVVTVREESGDEVDLPSDARVQAVWPLDRIPQLPLRFPEDPATAVDRLLEALRVEPKKGAQRRAFLAELLGAEVPDDPDADRLGAARIAELTARQLDALRTALGQTLDAGDTRALLAALQGPARARPTALAVAAERRVAEAVPLLAGAALREAATPAGAHALAALVAVAPERALLVASQGLPAALDRVPEASRSAAVIAVAFADDTFAETLGNADDASLVHVLLAVSSARAAAVIDALPSDRRERLTADVARLWRSIAARGGTLTPYDRLLRVGLARVLLAGLAGEQREVLHDAVRVLLGAPNTAIVRDAVLGLPDRAARRLVRALSDDSKRAPLLAEVVEAAAAERRAVLAPFEEPLLKRADDVALDAGIRERLLLAVGHGSGQDALLARAAGRLLRERPPQEAESIVAFVVARELPLALSQLGAPTVARLIDASADHPDYLARLLTHVRESGRGDSVATNVAGERVADSPALTTELLTWLDAGAAARDSLRPALLAAVVASVREGWPGWSDARRAAVWALLRQSGPAEVLPIVGELARRPDAQREALDVAVAQVLDVEPALYSEVAGAVPEPALRERLVARLAARNAAEHEAAAAALDADAGAVGRLLSLVTAELERAESAFGESDQMGVLLRRLRDDVRTARTRLDSQGADRTVTDFQARYGDAATLAPDAQVDALLAALRHVGVRSRATPAARAFFDHAARALLRRMSGAALRDLVRDRRAALERLDLGAVELVSAALLARSGASAAGDAWSLVADGATPETAVRIAAEVWAQDASAALALLNVAGVPGATLAHQAAQAATPDDTARPVLGTGMEDCVRRLAPTLDALDSVVLHYARVRRALRAGGLAPVEPALASVVAADQLRPGDHRLIGDDASSGRFEVTSQGLADARGRTIVPAAVVRLSRDDAQ